MIMKRQGVKIKLMPYVVHLRYPVSPNNQNLVQHSQQKPFYFHIIQEQSIHVNHVSPVKL
jgi:hypothetical protein